MIPARINLNRIRVGRDRSGLFSRDGLPWVVYCPCCHWGAPFTAWHYVIGYAHTHRRQAHTDTGLRYSRPVDTDLLNTPIPDGVALIRLPGRSGEPIR